MINKIKKHYKQSTLLPVIRNILFSWLPKKKTKLSPVRFIGRVTESPAEAIKFLVGRISELNKDERISLLISGEDQFSTDLVKSLNEKSVSFKKIDLNRIATLSIDIPEKTGSIFTSYLDAKTIHKIGEQLLANNSLTNIPFEYVCIPKGEYPALEKYDDYNSYSFVSPLLTAELNFNEIYEKSLDRFDLRTPYFRYTAKCDIRDFMDLSQLVTNVIRNEIKGDIAEFGSYKGHSGFLISELLNNYRSDKLLYMFDTFEEFPGERLGIDSFWSNTHKVNYEEVKSRLSSQDNIKLVKGDFTETLPLQSINKLSFIYVDCDSYRATKFLIEHLYENVLSRGGIMVFEDYGHPALLGNRLAVQQFFDERKDCLRFFSQFSGFYIVVKQ
jgi:Macrocin-O-methyltransferase (TylF)